MNSFRFVLPIFILAFLGTMPGCSTVSRTNTIKATVSMTPEVEHSTGQSAPVFISSYIYTPFDEMLKSADSIFVGQITNIGLTRWNQDSGEYWEETIKDEIGETTISAFPYYEVTISPIQIIVDSIDVENQVVITVLGGNDFSLKNGDEIVVFVSQSEISWYYGEVTYDKHTNSFESGRKSVLGFTTAPDQSYLLKGPDGLYQFVENYEQLDPYTLDELINLIRAKRGTP